MTSSLVGSEMCIRDSQEARRLLRPEKIFFPDAATDVVCKQMQGELSEGCLLYTSDAADDM
eukprot:8993506-Prorocentrum_lima.AAC.1